MSDLGQTAYEARFSAEDFARKWAHPWNQLSSEQRDVWARVERAATAHLVEAGSEVLAVSDAGGAAHQKLRAAIAKATGSAP